MTFSWSFFYNSFIKFHGKKNLGATALYSMTMLYPNLCYSEVCLHCTLFEEDTIDSYMNVINLQSADETIKVSL